MAKGNELTFSERRRLKQIYKENQVYMARINTYSDYKDYTYKTTETLSKMPHSEKKKKSSIVPIIIFMVIVIMIVAAFYFYPDLANFSI